MLKHIALAATLVLAACGSSGEDNESDETESTAPVEQTPANFHDDPNNSVVPLSPPTPAPTPSASPVAALPAGFQGRWGMVANDCIPGRSDAGGLMIVSASGLGFPQSRAVVERAETIRPDTLQLDLAFSDEGGREWNRRQMLTLLDGGKTLVREEQRPAGSFRYSRCPAGEETPVDQRGA